MIRREHHVNKKAKHTPPYPARDAADDTRDQMDELDFSEDESAPRIGDPVSRAELDREQPPERAREAGLTSAARPDHNPTDDDVTPQTLLDEDGARSPDEPGSGRANDETLRNVGAQDIGGRYGLDEAELGRAHPLDGKPWDGDPNEPITPSASAEKGIPRTPSSPASRSTRKH